MKRVTQDVEQPAPKRQKSAGSLDLFDDDNQKQISDIIAGGADGAGFIQGKIMMKWPNGRILLQIPEGRTQHRLEVMLSGRCTQFVGKELSFAIGDVVRVGLKGGQVKKKPSNGGGVVEFVEGVVIKWVSSSRKVDEEGKVVDVWELIEVQERAKANQPLVMNPVDDWYSTPPDPPAPEIAGSRRTSAGATSDDATVVGDAEDGLKQANLETISAPPIRAPAPVTKDASKLTVDADPRNSRAGVPSAKATRDPDPHYKPNVSVTPVLPTTKPALPTSTSSTNPSSNVAASSSTLEPSKNQQPPKPALGPPQKRTSSTGSTGAAKNPAVLGGQHTESTSTAPQPTVPSRSTSMAKGPAESRPQSRASISAPVSGRDSPLLLPPRQSRVYSSAATSQSTMPAPQPPRASTSASTSSRPQPAPQPQPNPQPQLPPQPRASTSTLPRNPPQNPKQASDPKPKSKKAQKREERKRRAKEKNRLGQEAARQEQQPDEDENRMCQQIGGQAEEADLGGRMEVDGEIDAEFEQRDDGMVVDDSHDTTANNQLPGVSAMDVEPDIINVDEDAVERTADITPLVQLQAPIPPEVQKQVAPKEPPKPRDPVLNFVPGFGDGTMLGTYFPVSAIAKESTPKPAYGMIYNVIAIVASSSEPKLTRTGSWSAAITLVDPSNVDLDTGIGFRSGEGFGFNLFTKTYKEWLPLPANGDVLLLRGIKRSEFNGGVNGVVYPDKLKWAIYKPSTSSFGTPTLPSNVPSQESLDDGFGPSFSPFWSPTAVEVEYCKRVHAWWVRAREEYEKLFGVGAGGGFVHTIGDGVGWNGRKAKRCHRLISEVSPEVAPDGFFDCTVEVVHGFLHDSGIFSLWVTDYTINKVHIPVDAPWCNAEFADKVMKIELFDDAAEKGKDMNSGEFWYLGNVKCRHDGVGGYYVGKMGFDPKFSKLGGGEGGEWDSPMLKALLERKAKWEESRATPSNLHALLSEVDRDRVVDCTVEILHTTCTPNSKLFVHVTDYTSNRHLSPSSSSWATNYPNQVLTISLRDGQEEWAKNMQKGEVYVIRGLWLKKTEKGYMGLLRGSERRIHKVNVKNSENENVRAFVRRKEEWERTATGQSSRSASPKPVKRIPSVSVTPAVADPRIPVKTIKDILTDKSLGTGRFRVQAKVFDFYPNLPDAFVLRCTSCNNNLAQRRKRCIDCDEDATCVVRLFFELEDGAGDRLMVSACDQEASPLKGFQPADPVYHPEALAELGERVKPFLGHLLDDNLCRNDRQDASDEPLRPFVVDVWASDLPKTIFRLVGVDG
ncbi:hypothetical protein JAAARDRAFT_204921 [Jaapia argillacea MUCL 33604]|uniref:Telomeric single stranded DNA binding POT1/Cdc13 domain-containing protein n=1 Tax=Jaapia argillacea MUCL 33604 TaxID=933084 RepID=A0A067Q2G8_9AGAM|nr:hypothetical protein JAAARDRAFT_204921 [Jaapia argillacea MUCL 33604]